MKYVDLCRLIRKLSRHKKDPNGMVINCDEIKMIIGALKQAKDREDEIRIEAIIDSVLGE